MLRLAGPYEASFALEDDAIRQNLEMVGAERGTGGRDVDDDVRLDGLCTGHVAGLELLDQRALRAADEADVLRLDISADIDVLTTQAIEGLHALAGQRQR